MYESFFGLKERPFNVTADPNFLFFSKKHREAFDHLIYGIKERKGFLEITGEIGTGKTTLCRALLGQLDKNTKTAFILNSNLPEMQLLLAIVTDLGLEVKPKTKINLLTELNRFLIAELKAGSNVVLIIDEAQNLKAAQLEQIRLLSNLETDKEKLIQIVLVGQPQLKEKLDSPELEQLRQRIAVRYHILPLDKTEVGDYIYHRLRVAGADGNISFEPDALGEVYEYSSGVPRLINLICDRTLLLGFAMETKTMTLDMIKRSVEEIEGYVKI
ncbi:MAG: AAA family ATPase [Candidatus Omnitrophica bacterium]|nr:AAA family ATPase [Candidatus Omnitrophota bacterium]